jgi:hypothetical protein
MDTKNAGYEKGGARLFLGASPSECARVEEEHVNAQRVATRVITVSYTPNQPTDETEAELVDRVTAAIVRNDLRPDDEARRAGILFLADEIDELRSVLPEKREEYTKQDEEVLEHAERLQACLDYLEGRLPVVEVTISNGKVL